MVYLTTVFHLKSVAAATLLNVFNGTTNLTPLLGAFLSDTYLGRYVTLGFASVSSLLVSPSLISETASLLPQLVLFTYWLHQDKCTCVLSDRVDISFTSGASLSLSLSHTCRKPPLFFPGCFVSHAYWLLQDKCTCNVGLAGASDWTHTTKPMIQAHSMCMKALVFTSVYALGASF